MAKGNLFDIAKENSKYRKCDGCNEIKHITNFKKQNKYCTGCKYVSEIREKYKNSYDNNHKDNIDGIDDINLDDFLSNL